MTGIYDIIRSIKQELRDHPIVNAVTFGDITEVDLDKTTMFPLSHFLLEDATILSNSIEVRISILFMDVVDYKKDYDGTDKGGREDTSNLVDVYNTQLQIANELISKLRRGDLYRDQYQLIGDPVCEPFSDRFENELAGWLVDMTISIPNNVSVC